MALKSIICQASQDLQCVNVLSDSPRGRYYLLHLRMESFLLTVSLLTLENHLFEEGD